MRLLGSTKKVVDQDKNTENVPKVVLVHCNLVKNDYWHSSKILFSFVPNKQTGQLINVSQQSPIMVNTVYTEFLSIEVWFANQNSKSLEIEDSISLILIIG